MTKSPCGKNCQERKVGCHSTCSKYEEWLIIHQAELDQMREQKHQLYAHATSTRNIRKGWQNKRYKNSVYRRGVNK